MNQQHLLAQLSERGQITLPAQVRKELALRGGDAFHVYVHEGRIVLEPVEVAPIELYTDERIEELLESADMTADELARARKAWGL